MKVTFHIHDTCGTWTKIQTMDESAPSGPCITTYVHQLTLWAYVIIHLDWDDISRRWLEHTSRCSVKNPMRIHHRLKEMIIRNSMTRKRWKVMMWGNTNWWLALFNGPLHWKGLIYLHLPWPCPTSAHALMWGTLTNTCACMGSDVSTCMVPFRNEQEFLITPKSWMKRVTRARNRATYTWHWRVGECWEADAPPLPYVQVAHSFN